MSAVGVGVGAAPGKVILFGEHAVVYGRPAIAATLGRGLGATAERDARGPSLHIPRWGGSGMHVRLNEGQPGFESIARAFAAALDAAGLRDAADRQVAVTLDGELPLGVGLGSSAAFAVALLRALSSFRGARLENDALIRAAAEVEHVFHGTPSGLDHTVVALGGCLRFQRQPDGAARWTALEVATPLPVVVAWTGRDGGTREQVARLRARHERYPRLYDGLFDEIATLSGEGEAALAAGDLEQLGALFDVNHGLLNACGVSGLANEQMVALARRQGALGAKLTGAGGGGAVLALFPPGADAARKQLAAAFEAEGFQSFLAEVGGE